MLEPFLFTHLDKVEAMQQPPEDIDSYGFGQVNEARDPGGETILEIRAALQEINPAAAEEFIRLYADRTYANTIVLPPRSPQAWGE